jgi:3-mercaptopyruvate sulfurtransferase SseA
MIKSSEVEQVRHLISLTAAVLLATIALALCIAAQAGSEANMAARSSSSRQEQGDGVRRVTVAELRDALDKGTAVVIDVRSEESYKEGHIKGARWIPLDEIASRVKELPRDKMIVTYCS